MILTSRRRAAELAEHRLLLARSDWNRQTRSLRANVARHRGLWIVGAGFGSGVLAAWLPLRGVGRALRALASVVSFSLRTPLAALFAESLTHKPGTPTSGTSASDSST
jgi:uncharacterized protein (DUF2062 family)